MKRRNFVATLAATSLLYATDQRKRTLIRRSTRPEDLEMPLEGFLDEITPVDQFFVRTHDYAPSIELQDWRLKISGSIQTEAMLSLDDIRRLPKVSLTAVLECAGNGRSLYEPPVPGIQWEYGSVGNAQWAGVRLSDVLAKAGIKGEPVETLFAGADRPPGTMPPFQRVLPLTKALHKDTILAYEMNGQPLSAAHGFPVRVVAPGWAGDNWMKWLSSIEVRTTPFEGFWMKSAYRHPGRPVAPGTAVDPATMKPVEEIGIKSVIATPTNGSSLPQGPVRISGAAWSGTSPVAAVDVSLDRGRHWLPAKLSRNKTIYGFRLFETAFNAPVGYHVVMARARNERGDIQPLVQEWNPSGYLFNAVHQVAFSVANETLPTTAPAADSGVMPSARPDALKEKCLVCHEEDIIRQQRLTRGQWEKEVDKMVRWGASVKPDERVSILDYLARSFGPMPR
jgi:DMSO/TMAO reductase YedYZ molybdopterin-dependent catalytic subunit